MVGTVLFGWFANFAITPFYIMYLLTAFSKCFWGGGYIKVGGGLVAEGNLWSDHRAWACRGSGSILPLEIFESFFFELNGVIWCNLGDLKGENCISFLPTWFTIICNISNNIFFILFHGHFNALFEGRGNYTEDCVVVCTWPDPFFYQWNLLQGFGNLKTFLDNYLETTFYVLY